MVVELTEIKKTSIISLLKDLKEGQTIKIRKFAKVVGFLVSCYPAVNYGWSYTKACERQKYLALEANSDNYESYMMISRDVMEEFK